jgi:hypothetical protein
MFLGPTSTQVLDFGDFSSVEFIREPVIDGVTYEEVLGVLLRPARGGANVLLHLEPEAPETDTDTLAFFLEYGIARAHGTENRLTARLLDELLALGELRVKAATAIERITGVTPANQSWFNK